MFGKHSGTGSTARVVEREHTADVALTVTAATPADLFAGAALGMARIVTGGERVEGRVKESIELADDDLECLLVGWLNALIGLYDADGLVASKVRVTLVPPARLIAEVAGERGVRAAILVKAATFHLLTVRETASGWEATIVFDV